jgi:hypothetical protein
MQAQKVGFKSRSSKEVKSPVTINQQELLMFAAAY